MPDKKLNILIVAPFIFYPLSEGGRISQFAMIDYLRSVATVTVVFTAQTKDCFERIDKLKELLTGVDVEIISLPVAADSVGFLPKVTRKLDWIANKNIREKKARETISEFDDEYFTNIGDVKSRAFIEQLVAITQKKEYDIAQVDMHSLIDLVYCLPAKAKKIFVQHEIRWVRLQSFLEAQSLTAGAYEKYVLSYIENTELDMLNKFDAIFTFSEIDRSKLLNGLDAGKVYVSPFPVLDNHIIPGDVKELSINKLVFIGGSIHAPNVDAIKWFVSNVLDKVSKKFNLKLYIAGNWDDAAKEFFHGNKQVVFSGFVADIVDYCKLSLMIVPVRIGGGIRTKILYAMAQGVPVISTTIGCEGIAVKDKESILIADDADSFIKNIEQALQDVKATKKRINKARGIIMETYSQGAAGKRRYECYMDVLDKNKNNV